MAGETEKRAVISNRNAVLVFGLIAGILLVVWIWSIWCRPPQMGPDPVVFKTMDALYTAVRNQDMVQVDACDKKLVALQQEGKFPPTAHQRLTDIIRQAKDGDWQPAAQALYQVMLAQKR